MSGILLYRTGWSKELFQFFTQHFCENATNAESTFPFPTLIFGGEFCDYAPPLPDMAWSMPGRT